MVKKRGEQDTDSAATTAAIEKASKRLLGEMTHKKILYLLSKNLLTDYDLYDLIRDFFKEYLSVDYSFTFNELISELDKVFIERELKNDLVRFLKKTQIIEYKDNPLNEEQIRLSLKEFDRLSDGLIKQQEKAKSRGFLSRLFGIYPRSSEAEPGLNTTPTRQDQRQGRLSEKIIARATRPTSDASDSMSIPDLSPPPKVGDKESKDVKDVFDVPDIEDEDFLSIAQNLDDKFMPAKKKERKKDGAKQKKGKGKKQEEQEDAPLKPPAEPEAQEAESEEPSAKAEEQRPLEEKPEPEDAHESDDLFNSPAEENKKDLGSPSDWVSDVAPITKKYETADASEFTGEVPLLSKEDRGSVKENFSAEKKQQKKPMPQKKTAEKKAINAKKSKAAVKHKKEAKPKEQEKKKKLLKKQAPEKKQEKKVLKEKERQTQVKPTKKSTLKQSPKNKPRKNPEAKEEVIILIAKAERIKNQEKQKQAYKKVLQEYSKLSKEEKSKVYPALKSLFEMISK